MAKVRSFFFDSSILYSPFNVLALNFDRAVLYGHVALSFVVLWTKTQFSSFWWKVLVIQKTCFEIKILKTFKIPSDCYISLCRSLNGRAILQMPGTVLQRKNHLTFCCKICWKKQPSIFCLLDETPCLSICTLKWIIKL